jgi:hypothetical protein
MKWFWAILDAVFYPPLCRLGLHRWETPPFLHMFAMFPQHRDYLLHKGRNGRGLPALRITRMGTG